MTHVAQHRRSSARLDQPTLERTGVDSHGPNRWHVKSVLSYRYCWSKVWVSANSREKASTTTHSSPREPKRRGAFTYRGRSVREDGWSSTDCARSAVDALQFDFPPIPRCYSTPLQPFPPSRSQRPRDAARASLRRKKGVNVDAIELCLIVIKKREPRLDAPCDAISTWEVSTWKTETEILSSNVRKGCCPPFELSMLTLDPCA